MEDHQGQVETPPDEPQGELWHRRPSESAHAYEAFRLWLEMPKRSLSYKKRGRATRLKRNSTNA
jgi:hypothetical protein